MDFADRFCLRPTILMLLSFALITSIKQSLLNPITCYISTELPGYNLVRYIEEHCWMQGILPIAMKENITFETNIKQSPVKKTTLYQWIPLLFVTQAALFYFTRLACQNGLFNVYGKLSNFRISGMLLKQENYQSYLELSVAGTIYQKIVTISHTVFQLGAMQFLVGSGKTSPLFGVAALQMIIKGNDVDSMAFLRCGHCSIHINERLHDEGQSILNPVNAECCLSENFMNDKIYIFVWWWIFFASFTTLISLFFSINKINNEFEENSNYNFP